MNNSSSSLGKYAIWRYRIAPVVAEPIPVQQAKRDLSSRIIHSITGFRLGGRKILKTETDKLVKLVKGAQNNLFVTKTVFPFVLFADTLKIDRQKLTIVHNGFLGQSQTSSTEIKNITNVQSDVGPLFGSITVSSKHFHNNTQTIKYLRRNDIMVAQRLLQGFIIAQRAKIDTDNIAKDQLLILLNDLGQENPK